MSDTYRIYGSEMSPYSVKVRSYFRYKKIPHEWCESRTAEAKPYQKLPLIPVVVTPEDKGMQDSTLIIEALEEKFPVPSIHPVDNAMAFLSALLEDFSDEWGNKWMFHYRWRRPADQDSAAERLVRFNMPGLSKDEARKMENKLKERMVARVWFVGSNEKTAPQIEAGFKEFIAQLETHLAKRSYLFGERPAFADFGLFGQLYCMWTDHTGHELIEAAGPNCTAWIQRMQDPEATGDFESRDALGPTLAPILHEQVGALYLPWMKANADALRLGAEEYTLQLRTGEWTQKPQKYHARAFAALRERYYHTAGINTLDPILNAVGCLWHLRG